MSESVTGAYQTEYSGAGYIQLITTLETKPAIGNRRQKIQRRNHFISNNFWRPHWQAEVTTRNKGLIKTMQESYGYHGLKSASNDWVRAYTYRAEASDAFLALQEVRDTDLQSLPEPEAIRLNAGTLRAMAEYLLATHQLDYLDDRNFQPHYKNCQPNPSRQQELDDIIEWLSGIDDEAVLALWQKANASERERLIAWDRELETAGRTNLGKDVIHYLETVSSQIVTDEDIEDHMRYVN